MANRSGWCCDSDRMRMMEPEIGQIIVCALIHELWDLMARTFEGVGRCWDG